MMLSSFKPGGSAENHDRDDKFPRSSIDFPKPLPKRSAISAIDTEFTAAMNFEEYH